MMCIGLEMFTLRVMVRMMCLGSNSKGNRSRGVQWKRFDGYDSMPFQHTDHFIVMCRSVPVEYASFTPTCNLMDMAFPPSCKLRSQRYGCVSVNNIRKANVDGGSLSPVADMNDTLLPLYSREMACVSDVHAVTHTKIESLRFAVLTMNSQVQTPNTTLLVVPFYTWLAISEELISNFSCSEYKQDTVSSLDKKIERERNGGKRYMNSKTATDELEVALQGFGVGPSLRQYPGGESDDAGLQDAAAHLLRRDAKTKVLMDEVEKRFALACAQKGSGGGKEECRDARVCHGSPGKKSKAPTAGDGRKLTSSEVEMERKATISALIDARSRVIALNDDLCSQEIVLNSSAVGKAATSKMGTSLGSGGIGRKRVAVLEALQTVPNIKNVKVQNDSIRKNHSIRSPRATHHITQSVVAKETASDRRQQRMILPYLKNKLDLIDDIVFQQTN